jgi:hypothetical protein
LPTICGVRLERENAFTFKLIWAVQSAPKKYFAFLSTQISAIASPSRPHHEGRFAIVTNRWARDAMDAARAPDESACLRTAKS